MPTQVPLHGPLVAQPGWLPHLLAALLALIGQGTGGILLHSPGLDSQHLLEPTNMKVHVKRKIFKLKKK